MAEIWIAGASGVALVVIGLCWLVNCSCQNDEAGRGGGWDCYGDAEDGE